MEDWEREYEEDRRRLAEGKGVDVDGRRNRGDDSDPFQDSSRRGGYEPPQIAAGSSGYGTAVATAGVACASGPAQPRGSKADEDAKIEALYSQYNETTAGSTQAVARDAGFDAAKGDARFGVNFVALPGSYAATFGEKIGRSLFFCDAVKMFFKGFFSPNELPMVLFVTSRCLYLGDEKSGELVLGRPVAALREVQVLGDTGVGLRGSDKGVDWYMQIANAVQRQTFVSVVTKIAQYHGTTVSTRTLSVEGEKTFKKEIRYVDRKEATWTVEEDPRSGLALVEVPEQHAAPYAPIVPKILHWFGGVFHIMKDWKGGNSQERRGCWLTATALFLSKPTGPQVDGRDITRCIGIEFMEELVDASGGQLGIIPDKEGPPQPHLALLFDTPELKQKMVEAIMACYQFRKSHSIKVTKLVSLEGKLKIEKEKDFKPHLFVMKTRNDLYGLLRGKK